MSETKKTEGGFFKKVGNFFKKVGNAIANFFKTAWQKFKAIPWNQPVKPVVAWSIIGGVLVVAAALALIFWL